MKHEIYQPILNITDTEITFEDTYRKPYVPIEYMEDIKRANLLLIPNENFREEGDVLFPETTREFLDFIREKECTEIIADIAISDDGFNRIELHSATIEVATIIVQQIVLPIVTGLVASFLYDLIKKYHRKPEETSTKVKIITEETDTKKSKMITYEGPVSGVKNALDQAVKEVFSRE